MKRDMDLVRKIILAFEEHPSGTLPGIASIDGYETNVIAYHIHIMIYPPREKVSFLLSPNSRAVVRF